MRLTRLSAVALLCASTLAFAGQHRNGDGSISDDILLQSNAQLVGPLNPLPVGQPDARGSGTLAAGTLNAAYAVALANGQGVVGFRVSGLSGSGSTLVPEGSNDGGSTWTPVNALVSGSPNLSQALTADQQFRVNGGGHTNLRLRVSVAGTGTIAVAFTATVGDPLVVLSAPAIVTPSTMAIAQTVLTLPAATSTTLVAANPARRSLRWMVTGTNPMTAAPGLVTVAAGAGMNYGAASGTGQQGGSESFEGPSVPTNAFSVISAGGTTVTVWEGQ